MRAEAWVAVEMVGMVVVHRSQVFPLLVVAEEYVDRYS
jgi:hypothetical protein